MQSFNHIGNKSAQIASSFVQPTDLLEKGKQAQPIGTIKEMGGRNVYEPKRMDDGKIRFFQEDFKNRVNQK